MSVTRSRAAVSRMVRASKATESSCSTTVAPLCSAANTVHCAAACMSGGAANHTPAPFVAMPAIASAVAPSMPPMAET